MRIIDGQQPDSTEDSPLFRLDEIQSNFYKLLSLFYSGIGIIQRDSPAENDKTEPDAILRLENNIKEIIGQFITTKDKLIEQIEDLERESIDFTEIDNLLKETRELDKILAEKVDTLKKELPLYKEYLYELIDEICE